MAEAFLRILVRKPESRGLTHLVIGASTVIVAYAGYRSYHWCKEWEYSILCRSIVDGNADGFLADQLENGELAQGGGVPSVQQSVIVDGVEVDTQVLPIAAPSNDVVRLNVEHLEVLQHRRIKKGRLSKAKRLALAEAKSRFGTPVRNAANERAVHHMVYNSLKKLGMQPGQMCMVVPTVVEMVFIPNKHEVDARAMYKSLWSWWRRLQVPSSLQC